MPRRQLPTHHRFKIEHSVVTLIHSFPGDPTNSIEISGQLEDPVLKAQKIAITMLSAGSVHKAGAEALGVTLNIWRIVATIDDPEFESFLTVVSGRGFSYGELLSEPVRRGRGRVKILSFSTDPFD